MGILLSIFAAAVANAPHAIANPYVGTYQIVRFSPDHTPIRTSGTREFMEIRRDGTWQMGDMMIRYTGHWKMAAKRLRLIDEDGPAGKIRNPQVWILKPKPNRSRLVIESPKSFGAVMEFRYDPGVRKKFIKTMLRIKSMMPSSH